MENNVYNFILYKMCIEMAVIVSLVAVSAIMSFQNSKINIKIK